MKALTLWRPWDQAILHGGKDIENRPWKLWPNQIGKIILLHAGKKYDEDGAISMAFNYKYHAPSDDDSPTGIVGAFIVDRVVSEHESVWFNGPFGWVIRDVQAFQDPIECRGMQGLWEPPPDVLYRCRVLLGRRAG